MVSIVIANTATPVRRDEETLLYQGRGALVPSLGAWCLVILTAGLALVVYALRRLGRSYRITTQRIVLESGIFSKRMEQIDLYRITDFVVERPFGQRVVGNGNLLIRSMDPTTPEVRLSHLDTNVVELYEKLRNCTELEKQARGVRVVDYDSSPRG
jgi:uncharacterized membrane protein YdbT with pleckstrin-like domain